MQVVSLRPELEFEVIKLVLLRESYLKRLNKSLQKCKEIELTITGLFDVLRETSIELVETIVQWERAQVCLFIIVFYLILIFTTFFIGGLPTS